MAKATSAQISAIKKATATELVRIDVEAGNKLAEINEAAARAAMPRVAEAPAPTTKAEAPKPTEGDKPAAEKKEEGETATAAAPAAPPAPATQASSELSALMEKLQKGMGKGGK